jgi:hypothetical protein
MRFLEPEMEIEEDIFEREAYIDEHNAIAKFGLKQTSIDLELMCIDATFTPEHEDQIKIIQQEEEEKDERVTNFEILPNISTEL